MRKLAPLYIFLLAGRLSAQMPAELTEWIDRHQNDYMFGMGISTNSDEAEAFQEAKSFAQAELTASVEVHITAAVQNFKSNVSAGGDMGTAGQFSTGATALANQVIKMSRVYGPVLNKRKTTYLIVYADKRQFQQELNDLLSQTFSTSDDGLDDLLSGKKN